MEHTVALSRQDLADIWQGIMPDIAATMKTSVSAIDHYMPGDRVSGVGNKTVFPELRHASRSGADVRPPLS